MFNSSYSTDLGKQMPLFHGSEARPNVPNVLIVGETGVGKSSLVNLIAGKQLAEIYSVPKAGTLEATQYDIALQDHQGHDRHIHLFDTAGTNEPHFKKTAYPSAIEKANALICQLQRTGGIHLLLFCICVSGITATTRNNFRLFSDVLCQSKVPVALVITGLENEDPMEDWWRKSESFLRVCGFTCTYHACVTAIRGRNDCYIEEYYQSQTTIRDMLLAHTTGSFTPWQPQWMERRLHLVDRLLKWLSGGQGPEEKELVRHLQDTCELTPSDAKYLATKIWAERLNNSVSR